jgi:hypothetical protein
MYQTNEVGEGCCERYVTRWMNYDRFHIGCDLFLAPTNRDRVDSNSLPVFETQPKGATCSSWGQADSDMQR